jgi:hypothetical protein
MMLRTMTMLAGGLLLCGALQTEPLSAGEPLKVTPAVRTVEAGDDSATTTTVGWRHRRFYGGYWGASSYWGGPFGGPFGGYYGVGYAPLSYRSYYHSSFYRPYGFGYYSAYRPVYVGSYNAYYGTPYIADYGSAVYAPPVYAAPVYASTVYTPAYYAAHPAYYQGVYGSYYGPSATYYGGYGPGCCW